ncbi:t-SNARE protein [Metarhizium rileyi]|uniref:Syntaxin n=1 Tax=Metarhizium rileyi (strain RCEF 4871) TaxID=1649241 RepID=A0A166Z9Q4_METRR|nr:t-SNARE protein [Metarhizium rileyi RCEF 4871]TWU73941.1 syntaxin [Metarhizium rileyi]
MEQQNGYGGRQNHYQQLGNTSDYYQEQRPRDFVQNQSAQPFRGQNSNYQATGSNFEMAPLPQTSRPGGKLGNEELQEIRLIEDELKRVTAKFDDLGRLQNRYLNEVNISDARNTKERLDFLTSEITAQFEDLRRRVQRLRAQTQKGSGQDGTFPPIVDNTRNNVTKALDTFSAMKQAHRKQYLAKVAREYNLAGQDASEQAIEAAIAEGADRQVFAQAMMQSNRTENAQNALNNMQSRHQELENIARTLETLAEMYQDMYSMVEQQDEVVMKIEEQTEEVNDNLDKGVGEIETAVKTARATRKKKWWCLGICVAIIIIIVVVVLIYIFVIRGTTGGEKKPSKRDLEELTNTLVSNFRSIAVPHTRRYVPGAPIHE